MEDGTEGTSWPGPATGVRHVVCTLTAAGVGGVAVVVLLPFASTAVAVVLGLLLGVVAANLLARHWKREVTWGEAALRAFLAGAGAALGVQIARLMVS